MLKSSKKHLEESQTRYVEHLKFALYASSLLLYAGIASLIHAFVPAAYKGTSAFIVIKLYKQRLIGHPNKRYQDWIKDGSNHKTNN